MRDWAACTPGRVAKSPSPSLTVCSSSVCFPSHPFRVYPFRSTAVDPQPSRSPCVPPNCAAGAHTSSAEALPAVQSADVGLGHAGDRTESSEQKKGNKDVERRVKAPRGGESDGLW